MKLVIEFDLTSHPMLSDVASFLAAMARGFLDRDDPDANLCEHMQDEPDGAVLEVCDPKGGPASPIVGRASISREAFNPAQQIAREDVGYDAVYNAAGKVEKYTEKLQ